MKKVRFLPLFALVLAIAASAFTTKASHDSKTSLYWFRYDEQQQQFVFDRHDTAPSVECDGLGRVCAEGFEDHNTSGETVYPGINMVDAKEKN